MARSTRSRLTPWIESLILNYGGQEEEDGGRSSRLKAHVVGVGQLTQSQARSYDGPIGVLFLSDGALQIPAVLTASAWEHLQEQEDRECFSSLLNTTVFLKDFRLQFHMDPQQTRCRFLLSVGDLDTASFGPVKDNTTCCTTLPSVRIKIYQTWRTLLVEEDSQRSQCGLGLSELLGEWQHDCFQAVLQDIQEKLVTHKDPQVSTCAHSASLTSWDQDRVRYQGETPFSVPVKFLFPEDKFQQLEAAARIRTQTEAVSSSVDDADWQIPAPAGVESACDAGERSPDQVEDDFPQQTIPERPLSNPWDVFPPPCVTSSSSDSSPEATPTLPAITSDPAVMVTSTQLPGHSSLPPYQKPLSTLPPISTSPETLPGSDRTPSTQQNIPTSNLEGTAQVNYRKPKRKRCDVTPERAEKGDLSGSPPSWLFESPVEMSRTNECSSPKQTVQRKIPSIHSDSSPFSYTYSVSGQNLQDFSQFQVAASVLRWAVKYLLTPAETPPNIS